MNNQSYYNTTSKEGEQLEISTEKAKSQEELVLDLFQKNEYHNFTPFEVLESLGLKAPVTSIRRAMTNLTKAGKLRKLDIKRRGDYGEPNYTWQLVR
jgi:hypothetical protein